VVVLRPLSTHMQGHRDQKHDSDKYLLHSRLSFRSSVGRHRPR
jgi:hypothetical protein